jgi:hypothetical protein
VQSNDGIVVVSVPDGAMCGCGAQMGAGERAGFDPEREEVICLWCLADRQAGRPPRRRQTAPARRLAPVTTMDGHRGRRASGRGAASGPRSAPRTAITLVITVLVVILFLGTTVAAKSVGFPHQSGSLPADDATAYAFMNADVHGGPVTWDPCLPIQLVVNSASAPEGADVLLAEAVERVNRASGLRLEVAGPTTQQPQPDASERELRLGRPGSARAPVLVAWTTPEVVPGLKGSIVGRGGPVYMLGSSLDRAKYIGGVVYLDGPQLARILRRPNGHAVARTVVMHELGHLVGLNHVDNKAEVMHPSGSAVTEFGQGDRAGLARLGSGGCPYDTTPTLTP